MEGTKVDYIIIEERKDTPIKYWLVWNNSIIGYIIEGIYYRRRGKKYVKYAELRNGIDDFRRKVGNKG